MVSELWFVWRSCVKTSVAPHIGYDIVFTCWPCALRPTCKGGGCGIVWWAWYTLRIHNLIAQAFKAVGISYMIPWADSLSSWNDCTKYSCVLDFHLKGLSINWFDPQYLYIGDPPLSFSMWDSSLSFLLKFFISNTPSHV